MKIRPSQLTVSVLLSGKNEQFYIPAYQRRYAWGNKQLVELFEDINLLDNKDSHFLGTILLLTESHNADINRLEVVDGQQRIITLTLLIEAIRDRFVELKENDIVEEINGLLLCQGIDRKKKNKILLGDLDEPDYSRVLKLKNENDLSSVDEIKNKNLLNAYITFKKRITAFDFTRLNEFYFKLMNNTVVVRLDTEKAKDAYKLFETINNRGLKLSPTDIIKNFLLGHASMVGEDTLKEVGKSWEKVIINLDGINADNFFRQYLMGVLGRKVTFSKLISEFKRQYILTVKESDILPEYRLFKEFKSEDEDDESSSDESDDAEVDIDKPKVASPKKVKKVTIIQFAKSLKDASEIYGNIVNISFTDKKINQHIYNLQRIDSKPAYTFLLYLFRLDVDKEIFISALKQIESFMLRRHICEYRTAELDDIFSKLTEVKSKTLLSDLRDQIADSFPKDEDFEEKISSHSFKRNPERAKYMLEQFEYDLIGDQGEYVLNSGNEVHLEHIMPQTIDTKKSVKEFGDWISYLGDKALTKHPKYVDRIGNYTLLAQKLNIKASNHPFKAKLREYKKSNIQLTQAIVGNFTTFKFSQIKNRSEEFSKIAARIWNLSKVM